MACEVMIHRNANNHVHPDPIKNRIGPYDKGSIVRVRENPLDKHSDKERETFAFVKITDADLSELIDYNKEWELEIDYKLIGSNAALDGHRYRIFSLNPGVSNHGIITREKIESYLNNWNVNVFSIAQNEIVVDVIILDMIKSKGFWDLDSLSGLTAVESKYVQRTGVHTINIGWSNFMTEISNRTKIASALSQRITLRNGTVISANLQSETGSFSIARVNVLKWFRANIFKMVRKYNMLYRRQFFIDPTYVDMLVNYSNNNNGNIYEMTKAQFLSYVKSMLMEASV